MNRRSFLQTAGAASVASGFSKAPGQQTSGGGNKVSRGGKPRRVGMIGCGWYGKIDLIRMIQVEPTLEVVSLCDVDSQMLSRAADTIGARQTSKKKPRTYGDYRKMLAERDLDIVFVATPDHWHALVGLEVMNAGADLYLQKPISVDVSEAHTLFTTARAKGRVVQVGMQRRSTPHIAEAKKQFIDEGKLGNIAAVDICCYYHMRATDNPPDTAPPEYLDYEMWTGPAPMRPYNTLVHPRKWRAFMEYGNGIVGDMCVHMLDMTRWMLGLGWPTRIYSSGGILVDTASKANITDTQTATFDFEKVKVVWQHRSWGEPADPKYPWSAIFYGDKGTLKVDVYGYDFIPMGKGAQPVRRDVTYEFEQFPEDRTEKDLERHIAPALRAHMKNFLSAIDNRGRPISDIEEGYISTASCILANNSLRLGRSLTWDSKLAKVVDDDEANKLLTRPYRAPWKHPVSST